MSIYDELPVAQGRLNAGARMTALESFARRVLHPEDLGHAVTDEVRGDARMALLADGFQLPLGSVTAPYPEDSACSSGGAPPPNPPRLALLTGCQHEASALLLASFHGTHRDVLDYTQLREDYQLGIRVAVGDFTHRPSGLRYIVAIAAVAEQAAAPAAERIGECELCGRIDHHLQQAACPACNAFRHLSAAAA